ncbi:hypothetical protein BOX15_Mlig023976g1 [Macrostomum lignano]|uniref:Uncharacterized protein n=1 Tax=Macrostomum lignano TaxID=282301 RepID=A0A267GJK8_9PLAT|nr:hypothetical protein BOX15_Mlig023976g1 [Macrostomum lignano]
MDTEVTSNDNQHTESDSGLEDEDLGLDNLGDVQFDESDLDYFSPSDDAAGSAVDNEGDEVENDSCKLTFADELMFFLQCLIYRLLPESF